MTRETTTSMFPSLAAGIRDALGAEIERGLLRPGAPLDEHAIAQRFNASRTPVREALRQLAAQELVRIVPRRGTFVSRLSITQLRSLLELLGELEALCAKYAARRSDERHRDAVCAALRRCACAELAGDALTYVEANHDFHEAIYAASRNGYLAEQVRGINRLAQRYRTRVFRESRELSRSQRDHERIADAILAGDAVQAHKAMLLHTPAGTTGFSEFLSTLPAEFLDDTAAPSKPAHRSAGSRVRGA
ncbi:GntR family transcriptional regulator [Aromatoleum toluclasticum]|uniref:GntR family transcriptional regulator n=1 Tax=Aromatoleum toluclasticum TaxID=92003 RepID=UPI00035DD871|nr:GntR family transcriptional regulator [Aromatoleum toluclasticum]